MYSIVYGQTRGAVSGDDDNSSFLECVGVTYVCEVYLGEKIMSRVIFPQQIGICLKLLQNHYLLSFHVP